MGRLCVFRPGPLRGRTRVAGRSAMVPLALQDEARRLVDGALDLLILMTRARAGAVFSCVSEPPRLALSLNLDDAALTAGLEVWSGQRHQLSAGLVFEHRRGLALAC